MSNTRWCTWSPTKIGAVVGGVIGLVVGGIAEGITSHVQYQNDFQDMDCELQVKFAIENGCNWNYVTPDIYPSNPYTYTCIEWTECTGKAEWSSIPVHHEAADYAKSQIPSHLQVWLPSYLGSGLGFGMLLGALIGYCCESKPSKKNETSDPTLSGITAVPKPSDVDLELGQSKTNMQVLTARGQGVGMWTAPDSKSEKNESKEQVSLPRP